MIHELSGVFAKDPKAPTVTNLAEFEIDTGEARPIAEKARRWAQKEADYIMEHVRAMAVRNQVEPSSGPWACNPVLARQGDRSASALTSAASTPSPSVIAEVSATLTTCCTK